MEYLETGRKGHNPHIPRMYLDKIQRRYSICFRMLKVSNHIPSLLSFGVLALKARANGHVCVLPPHQLGSQVVPILLTV